MAKWGEGDPRWIVEDRADGTNVNNWHWTEKNANGWSIAKLKSLLQGLKVEDEIGSAEITEVTSVEGEASASNRKAKLIFFYEWLIKAEWKGLAVGHDDSVKGDLEIPNLSEEKDVNEIDVNVSVKNDKKEHCWAMKEMMRKKGAEVIREKLKQYIDELKSEYSKGLILPSKVKKEEKSKNDSMDNKIKQAIDKPVRKVENIGVKISTAKLSNEVKFICSVSDLYSALTDKGKVQFFTRNAVDKYESEKGGSFSLFGGTISGDFTELVYDEKIAMRWRLKDWPEAHYSVVTITLKEGDNGTELSMTQTGIPLSDLERTKQGWDNYYWNPIKQAFGFGAKLY